MIKLKRKNQCKILWSAAPFLSYNGSDKSKNPVEQHLQQIFLNDENLNNNKTILIAI